jgi:hypothetical protein
MAADSAGCPGDASSKGVLQRLWTYQAERFPVARTALLVAVFSAAGVSASARFAGRSPPGPGSYLLAFSVTLRPTRRFARSRLPLQPNALPRLRQPQ